MGVLKGVKTSECGFVGEFRNFMITFIPNIIFGFWAMSMWMNYKTIQKRSQDLIRSHKFQRYLYLGLLASCIMIIFLNFSLCKYNSDVWCRVSDNRELAEMYMRNTNLKGFYSGTAHYCFTFMNLGIYAASLFCVA